METSEIKPASRRARLWARLSDLDKRPRCWWYPPSSRRNGVLRISGPARQTYQKVLQQAYEKFSETIRLALLSLLGVAFFCLLITFSTPDSALLVAVPTIKTPFADVQVSFQSFLILAPSILIIIILYLHIFYGYWLGYKTDYSQLLASESGEFAIERLPTLFSLDHVVPRLLTAFIFYWLVPLVLLMITRKTSARVEWWIPLAFLTGLVTVTLAFLQIRRCPASQRRWNRLRWGVMGLIVLGMAVITVQLLAQPGLAGVFSAERTELVVVPRWLQRPLNLVSADLKGKWLTAVNLRDACARLVKLQGANLQGTDLRGAKLSDADLRRADLQDANFYGAELKGAILKEAKLERVDFRRADLTEVDLAGATLDRANLQEAHLKGAQVIGNQLAAVKTLYQATDLDPRLENEIQQIAPRLRNAPVPANVKAVSQIDSPHDGTTVGKKITVRGGLGPLAPNERLWLAVEKGNRIWPKEPEVPVTDSSWTVTVYEEGTRSRGRFKLVLYLVEDEGHQRILEWLRDGKATDAFPGLEKIRKSRPLRIIQLRMPLMLPGC